MATAEDVQRAITTGFREPSQPGVQAALELYGDSEACRVKLAILALADGDPDQVLPFVEAACQDYLNVLYWAEYPEESFTGQRTRAEMAERYRRLGAPVPDSLAR